MRVERRTKSKKRTSKANHGLLATLVDSHFYQVLVGKASLTGPWVPKSKPKKNEPVGQRQSISSMSVDVVLFMMLVVIAPFFNIAKAVFRFINEFWIIKFFLGILCGLICVAGFILVLHLIFGWPNFIGWPNFTNDAFILGGASVSRTLEFLPP